MKTLNYGLIGCGMMGHEHIRNIQLLNNTNVLAIVEPDADMRKQAATIVPDALFVNYIAELLAIEALDCLVIISPNFMHADQLREIADTRALPVLVEKPLYTSADDAAFIAQLQANYSAPIWVAMEYRYMPPLAALIEQVSSVTSGVNMLSIREHRFPFLEKVQDWNRFNRYSGGTFVEKCCHYFDLMRLIIGAEPVSAMAAAGQVHNHLDERYAGETPDIWDHGYVIFNFDNGAKAMLELCMFAEGSTYQEEISAVGVNGKIECLIPGPARFWPEHLGTAPLPKLITSPRSPAGAVVKEIPVDQALLDAGDHNGSTFYQHQRFQQVVLGNATVDVTASDGAIAVRMGMAAQESARSSTVIQISN